MWDSGIGILVDLVWFGSFGGFTGWAVVVAGQDCALVVTQALPVVVVTVADSGAGGGEAVGDDAVGNVRLVLFVIWRTSRTHQWQCRSQIANQQKPRRLLLRLMWWTERQRGRRRPGRRRMCTAL